MYRITGEEKWRKYGWEIFQAIEANTKTQVGYCSIENVEVSPPRKKDSSPRLVIFNPRSCLAADLPHCFSCRSAFCLIAISWLRRTFFSLRLFLLVLFGAQSSWWSLYRLKYLYLMFDDEDHYPLDKWVLNTEAHPLPVFQWTQEEKEKFGIP